MWIQSGVVKIWNRSSVGVSGFQESTNDYGQKIKDKKLKINNPSFVRRKQFRLMTSCLC